MYAGKIIDVGPETDLMEKRDDGETLVADVPWTRAYV